MTPRAPSGDGWLGIAEARARSGLRLVLLRGLPSPWSLAARHLFEAQDIAFVKVQSVGDDERQLLVDWTGQDGYPVAVYEDERPRSGWAEILHLAERLSARPALIPSDPRDRVLMFGLAQEILGELGLAWCRRLIGLRPHFETRPDDPEVQSYRRKYGSSGQECDKAARRTAEVLRLLSDQLRRQHELGREFLVGPGLSAVDFYWAATSHLFAPLADPLLPLPDALRASLTSESVPLRAALSDVLLAHRDSIYRRFVPLPVEI